MGDNDTELVSSEGDVSLDDENVMAGLCSINFTTTRISPRKASSPEVPAHTDRSEYAGCFPGANPPTLKSDMKASSESRSSAVYARCSPHARMWMSHYLHDGRMEMNLVP
ncbi:hypothetical protein WN943_010215 [Citrus x changshan-huyou]